MTFCWCVCVRGNMDFIAKCILRRTICILQKFIGNIDLSKLNPSDLEQKNLYCIAICILHAYCTSQYAYCDKNCSMHIAIKKSETSSPQKQTRSNTFHGTLGWHFIVYCMISISSTHLNQCDLLVNLTINSLEKRSGVSQWWSMC